MILENKRRVIRYRFKEFIGAVIAVSIFAFLLSSDYFSEGILGLSDVFWSIVTIMVYMVLIAYHFYLDLNYIYFSDSEKRVVFRYYSIRPFNDSKNAIEMDFNQFGGYSIDKRGLRTYITLYRNMGGNKAKYPEVSITSLSKEQQDILKKSLDKIS
ncbi:MAG: hypothetical protein N4A72_03110 [Bacteroidales bacterium]|jgi:hypothetical protein|nr:hypothetical protein [Bacteroidales bacterium]